MAGSVVLRFCRALAAAAVTGIVVAAPASAAPAPISGPQLTLAPIGDTVLTFNGQPYHGDLVVGEDGSQLAVVNRVGFEQCVQGIAEMPSNWPSAALEAQAVAARTYALWEVLTHPTGPAGGQICATDACQVYAGLDKTDGPDGSNWLAAVNATRGNVLLYRGDVIEALYGSSDGGQTLYGGVPWLPTVSDPQDRLSPEHQWSWSATLQSMASVLAVGTGKSLVGLVSSSQAITETLKATDGSTSTVAVSPDRFHSLINAKMAAPAGLDLPLPSGRYSVSTAGSTVQVSGYGDGNGLGLSQYGALGKALQGWSAGQILASYYGPARATPLSAGDEPPTIGATLADPVGQATLGATGPVQVLGPDGHVIATASGGGSWEASEGPSGVSLAPSGGAPLVTPATGSDTAPIPAFPATTAPSREPSSAATTAGPLSTGVLVNPALDESSGVALAHGGHGVPAAWIAVAVVAVLIAMAGCARALVLKLPTGRAASLFLRR